MRPLAFTFPYVIVFVATVLWAFVREAGVLRRATRDSSRGKAPHDKGSLRVVMITQSLGFMAAYVLAFMPWGRFGNQRIAFWTGVVLYIAGALLRRLCFRALGESFTGEVRVRAEQSVITTGPYRWVRHPSYSAGLLMSVGVAIALGTWLGALIVFALTFAGYAYRVRVEENALMTTLGASYRDYAARTKRFIPFVV